MNEYVGIGNLRVPRRLIGSALKRDGCLDWEVDAAGKMPLVSGCTARSNIRIVLV